MSTISLKIPESQKQFLTQQFLARRSDLLNELSGVDEMLRELGVDTKENKPIDTSKKGDTKSTQITKLENGYILQWSFLKKIVFILNNNEEGMTAKQLTNSILEYEKDLDFKKVFATVSGQLSNKIKAGENFERVKNELDEYVYKLRK